MYKRNLLLNYKTPTPQRYDTAWVYHFPNKQLATIRCPHGTGWATHKKKFLESGFIRNATTCSIATKEIRTLPELRRTDYTRLDTPAWYAPDLTPALAPNELPQKKEDLPAAVREFDEIKTRLATPLRSLDFDTLFQIWHITLQQGHQTHWYLIAIMTSCVLVVILIMGYSPRFQIQLLLCGSPVNNAPESNQAPQASPRTLTPEYAAVDIKKEQPCENIAFTSYSIQISK